MLDLLRRDTARLRLTKARGFPWYVLESLLFENGYQAVVLYRLASWLARRRLGLVGRGVARLSRLATRVWLDPRAAIGPGLVIAHGTGLVVGPGVTIGRDAILLHRVRIEADGAGRPPRLGDGVFVAAGAEIVGDLEIGDGALIGAATRVTSDVPAGGKATSEDETRIEPPPPSG